MESGAPIPVSPYISLLKSDPGKRLTIYFSQRQVPAGKFGGSNISRLIDGSVLGINCPDTWYCSGIPGIGETRTDVLRALHKIIAYLMPSEIQTVGSSMGGYGALSFGSELGAARVISLAPEIYLGMRGSRSRGSIPDEPHRRNFAHLKKTLNSGSDISVILGDLETIDCVSASLAKGLDIEALSIIPGAPHAVADVLAPDGRLIRIINGSGTIALKESSAAIVLPTRLSLLAQLAFVCRRERKLKRAARLISYVIEHGPVPTSVPVTAGSIFFDMKDYDGAIRFFSMAIGTADGSPTINFSLGRALLEAGRPMEAIPYIEKYDLARPGDANVAAYLSRARAAVR